MSSGDISHSTSNSGIKSGSVGILTGSDQFGFGGDIQLGGWRSLNEHSIGGNILLLSGSSSNGGNINIDAGFGDTNNAK